MTWSRKSTLRAHSKHSFTLIEVVVSLGLLSILLVILFGMYYQITSAQAEMEIIRERAFSARHLQSRLSAVLSKVSKSPANGKKAPFYLLYENHSYSIGESLVFTYDNGYSCDPDFIGDVTGRLFLSPNGGLQLATWPLKSPQKMRKELLQEGVRTLSFSFLTKEGGLRQEWSLEEPGIPIATQLLIEPEEGEPFNLSFVHANALQAHDYGAP